MRFVIETNHDGCYTAIMDNLVSKGLTHSKDQRGNFTSIEILGSPDDFVHFRSILDNYNQSANRTCGIIIEGI
jgi:hypothetical protein